LTPWQSFVTPETTGAMYDNEGDTISISINLLPLYVMFGLMCLFNLGFLIWIVYDRTEFRFLRHKVDDGVVTLQPREESEKHDEESVKYDEESEKHSSTEEKESAEADLFTLEEEETTTREPKFQNDNLSSDEFTQKMLK
jgi:hypothetical protein